MRARQLRQLGQMNEADRRACIAEALARIADHVMVLLAERDAMAEAAPRSVKLTELVAVEEAAKGLILVDYLRPHARVDDGRRAKHLRRAYDHLSRGIYDYYYRTRPGSYGETMVIVEGERDSHYLDGPEGVEWVFRNRILQNRETLLYVDLVEREGELDWLGPSSHPRVIGESLGGPTPAPMVCRLFLLLHACTLLEAEPRRVLGEVWRDVELTEDTHWQACADLNVSLNRAGIVGDLIT